MQRYLYKSRPPASCAMARKAWDRFTKRQGEVVEPVEMWNAWLDYWCWVAQFADGSTDEIPRNELWEPGSTEMQRNRSGVYEGSPLERARRQ
jgi:transcription elongation factor Elf1